MYLLLILLVAILIMLHLTSYNRIWCSIGHDWKADFLKARFKYSRI